MNCTLRVGLCAAVALFSMTGFLMNTATAQEANVKAQPPEMLLVYIGTYTRGSGSKGIYRCELDMASGKLTPVGEPTEAADPSFLAIHPNGKLLFAVNELAKFEGQDSGAVSSFAINGKTGDGKTGDLTFINQQASRGAAPCHLVVDRAGTHVLLANYTGGSVAAYPIDAAGKLGEASSFVQHEGSSVMLPRQATPHAHSINLDAAGRFAMAADLGLDKVLVYRYSDKTGKLEPNDPPSVSVEPASGPRHFAFHPDGKHAYVINEIKSTVTALAYDAEKGVLTALQTISTLPADFDGRNSTADVQVHPSGKFVYGSNRGHNSIAIFAVDAETGKLTTVGQQPSGGKTPRGFGIDPTGRYLLTAGQDSNNVVVFRIDAQTGKLAPTGSEVEIPKPVCIKFLQLAP
jgi:6-phosphogluconolactonase